MTRQYGVRVTRRAVSTRTVGCPSLFDYEDQTPDVPLTRRERSTMPPTNTCGSCPATWTGTRPCHCAACHTTFAGIRLFDAHRSQYGERGSCLNPATLTTKNGEPIAYLRDGIWSGPEMEDEARTHFAQVRKENRT